ncbi:MAG: DegT/DnrJ/EryC1/StrS family aminotransferase, partial [Candidatus Omnitrophica bacterium]|nr:DegT/DnrJ/EryC1/StrS family aminotransferase [Candidatus Omnitrophota bacterium]
AIRYVNAIPVFADIVDETDLTIDPGDIDRLVNERTKAVVVMHYAGFPCNMDAVIEIASDKGLKVIEDACHGPLAEYRGKKLGALGDVGCFSFFSNKNLSTGEGGMLVTGDSSLYERAKRLRSHGMTTLSYERSKGHSMGYDVVELGHNYRMDDIRASLGIVQLAKLEDDLVKRAKVRAWYEEALAEIDEVIVPFRGHTGFVSNYIFPVVIRESCKTGRDEVRKSLQERGVQTSLHYPPVHLFSIYREYTRHLPVTESVVERLITLPMYSKLCRDDVDMIVRVLRDAVRS